MSRENSNFVCLNVCLMRLWSIHPKYLDPAGLGAVWREGLLAQKVLQGQTKGYRHHPQLARFLANPDPAAAIASYLAAIAEEAARRGYRYDAGKIAPCRASSLIPVTLGQIEFETRHLRNKLQQRTPSWPRIEVLELHPLFIAVPGPVEPWEKGAARAISDANRS